MSKSDRKLRIEPAEKLVDAGRHLTSMGLPVPVHHRLDELVSLGSVMKTSRAEIVAMLIAQAEPSRDDLVQSLLRYREMTAGELFASDEPKVVPLHGPGRRRSSS